MSPAKFGWQVKLWFFGTIHRDNIGTFTDGPFNPNEDPIGAMINFVGCAPGNEEAISINGHTRSSIQTFIQQQDIAFAKIIPKRSSMLGHSFSVQSKICVQDTSSTGNRYIQIFFLIISHKCSHFVLSLRCLCKDGNTIAKAPFDVMKAYACQPKKV